jgi:hypothetical protein
MSMARVPTLLPRLSPTRRPHSSARPAVGLAIAFASLWCLVYAGEAIIDATSQGVRASVPATLMSALFLGTAACAATRSPAAAVQLRVSAAIVMVAGIIQVGALSAMPVPISWVVLLMAFYTTSAAVFLRTARRLAGQRA